MMDQHEVDLPAAYQALAEDLVIDRTIAVGSPVPDSIKEGIFIKMFTKFMALYGDAFRGTVRSAFWIGFNKAIDGLTLYYRHCMLADNNLVYQVTMDPWYKVWSTKLCTRQRRKADPVVPVPCAQPYVPHVQLQALPMNMADPGTQDRLKVLEADNHALQLRVTKVENVLIQLKNATAHAVSETGRATQRLTQAVDRIAALEKALESKRNAKTSAKRGGATLTQSEAKRLKAEEVRSTDSA